MGMDQKDIASLPASGKWHLERGARTFATWSDRMFTEYGEKVRPFLRQTWDQLAKDYPELMQARVAEMSKEDAFDRGCVAPNVYDPMAKTVQSPVVGAPVAPVPDIGQLRRPRFCMHPRQVAVCAAVAVTVIMLLFPPWQYSLAYKGVSCHGQLGCSFLAAAPGSYEVWTSIPYDSPLYHDREELASQATVSIDTTMLCIQVAIVVVLLAGVLYILPRKDRSGMPLGWQSG